MKTVNKLTPFYVPLSVSLLVAACGTGNDAKPTPVVATPAVVTGTVSKGIVKLGVVTATELDTSGKPLTEVGNAVTSADGSYSLTLDDSYNGGPIELTLTLDDQSQMKCDAPMGCGDRDQDDGISDTTPTTVDFGEWYKPNTLTMTALIAEANAGDTIKASITPFTHLAATRAKQSATLNAAAVFSANSAVSRLIGNTDILNTAPVDITDEKSRQAGQPGQRIYGALSASISALADKSAGQPDLDAALNALSAAYTDGEMEMDDGDDKSKISLKDILTGTTLVLDKTGVSDASGVIANIKETIASKTTPQPDGSATAAASKKVREFVQDVRTWGNVILQETDTKARAFADETVLATTAAQGTTQLLIGPAFKAAINAVKLNFENAGSVQYTGELIKFGLGFTQGTLTNTNGVVTIADAMINGTTVNMNVNVVVDGVVNDSITLGISTATFVNPASEFNIEAGTLTLALKTPYSVDIAAINTGTAARIDVKQGTLEMRGSMIQKQDAQGNALTSAVTYRGGWKVTLVNPIRYSQPMMRDLVWMTPKHVEQTGEITTASGHSLKGTYTFDVVNADTFTPVGELPVGHQNPKVATWWYTDSNNDQVADLFTWKTYEMTMTARWIQAGNTTPNVELVYTFFDGQTFRFQFATLENSLQEFVTGPFSPIGGDTYVWVRNEGTYFIDASHADFSVDGSVGGTLVNPDFIVENAMNWLDAEAALTFELQLAQLPKAMVSVSANRNGYSTGSGDFRIAYGTRQMVVHYEKGANANSTSVTITNQNGVEVTLIPDTGYTQGQVMYNGKSYATIQKLDNGMIKVTYLDGVIEIF